MPNPVNPPDKNVERDFLKSALMIIALALVIVFVCDPGAVHGMMVSITGH